MCNLRGFKRNPLVTPGFCVATPAPHASSSHISQIDKFLHPVHFHSMHAKGRIKHSLLAAKQIYIFASHGVQLWWTLTSDVTASTNNKKVYWRQGLLLCLTSRYCMILAIKNTNSPQLSDADWLAVSLETGMERTVGILENVTTKSYFIV